jgi:translation initiation factor 2 alpha subunit (eIF-2alpha)
MRHIMLAALLLLSSCAGTTTASTTAAAQAVLNEAVNYWGVAKGVAEVAVIAQPELGPVVSAAEAVIQPLVDQAQATATQATVDIAAATALAQQIQAQIAALTVKTAPAVKVVPGAG